MHWGYMDAYDMIPAFRSKQMVNCYLKYPVVSTKRKMCTGYYGVQLGKRKLGEASCSWDSYSLKCNGRVTFIQVERQGGRAA